MELLLAANRSDKGASHDFSSSAHARGHADPQFGGEHPGVLRPTDLTLRTLLQSVSREVGAGADSYLSALPDERKEVGYSSILMAISALRFLYKVTLKKDWTFADIIPAPKKP